MSRKSQYNIFGGGPPRVVVNMEPHAGQMEITNAIATAMQNAPEGMDPSVFVIIGSRGWGKTLYLVAQVLLPYVANNPNGRILWVGPQYQTALAFVEDVLKATDEETDKRWVPEFDEKGNRVWEFIQMTATGPQVKFWNGCTVTIKSADSPDSIVGRGYNLIIIDEAAMIEERVFVQQIMGTARKRGIKIFIITSPRGKRHWTYRYFMKGQDKADPTYMSFKQPWYKNPKFSPTLQRLMKDLPDWIRRQEYEAEFLEDGDTVFKNLMNVLVGEEISFPSQDQEWRSHIGPFGGVTLKNSAGEDYTIKPEHRRFVCGLDLAKSIDFTVFYVMCMDTGDCMYYRRLNKTGYDKILELSEDICQYYNNAELIYDATGVGSGLGDFFNNHNVSVVPYVFTNESKSELVTSLAVAIEYSHIRIPNIQTIVNELGVFTYALTRTGKLTYNAPSGYHDDIVMSMALANWYRKENTSAGNIATLDDFLGVASGRRASSMKDFMENDND